MEGWIKISRKITKHWLWTDGQKLKWWLDLLLTAQWDDGKVMVGNNLVELKRGELIYSVLSLSERWGCCRRTVSDFLAMLQCDNMICSKECCNRKSILTICNFEIYQDNEEGVCSNTNCITHDTKCGSECCKTQKKRKEPKEKEKCKEKNVNTRLRQKNAALEKESLLRKAKVMWIQYYKRHTGEEYYWEGKDGANMNALLRKLERRMTSEGVEKTEDSILEALRTYLMSIADRWLIDNLSVSNVASKYNETRAKKGTTAKPTTEVKRAERTEREMKAEEDYQKRKREAEARAEEEMKRQWESMSEEERNKVMNRINQTK